MGGWALLVGVAVAIGTACGAVAGEDAVRCGGNVMTVGRVASISDGRSFALDSGREVRVAALEVPLIAPGSPASTAAHRARAELQAILAGRTVALRAAEPASDRYGRAVAHVYFQDGYVQDHKPQDRKPPERSIARAMLAKGLAQVAAAVGDTACAAELLSQERVARSAGLGLWADPHYGIVGAGSLDRLVARQGRFAVAEGKVASVRTSGATIYVNFGRRWSQALTVTISKRREPIFARGGLVPKELENRRLRVRGWVEFRNGPRIEASRPEQIEIVELN
jgi:endonuclease YncB( thermonuclease family)